MHDATLTLPVKTRIPAKSVALPVEHGAWGFLFEPLLAGLLIAPTVGGGFLSIMIVGAFLCRQPLKFVFGDLKSGKRLPRTAVAMRWLVYFSAIAAFGLAGSLVTADPRAFIPLIISAPIAIYLIVQDASGYVGQSIPMSPRPKNLRSSCQSPRDERHGDDQRHEAHDVMRGHVGRVDVHLISKHGQALERTRRESEQRLDDVDPEKE